MGRIKQEDTIRMRIPVSKAEEVRMVLSGEYVLRKAKTEIPANSSIDLTPPQRKVPDKVKAEDRVHSRTSGAAPRQVKVAEPYKARERSGIVQQRNKVEPKEEFPVLTEEQINAQTYDSFKNSIQFLSDSEKSMLRKKYPEGIRAAYLGGARTYQIGKDNWTYDI